MKDVSERQRRGQQGEKLARRFLRKLGYRFLAENYATQGGEIDLVMDDNGTLVFVEVKTRSCENFAPAQLAVNYAKQQRLWKAARHLLLTHNLVGRPLRFDVVAVIAPAGREKPVIRHYPNAFVPPNA